MTAIIQSSSVTSVLVVGFVTSGLMTLTQAAGVIMGANIGTTVTAQIIALDVTKYALGLVTAGFLIAFVGKAEIVKARGARIMGLGLIFFGMEVMGEATAPLREVPAFTEAMILLDSPLVGILVGLAFTAVVQSSSATTALVIVLASQGLLSLEAGIALILGSNIGTCVTALLATLGKPRDALCCTLQDKLFESELFGHERGAFNGADRLKKGLIEGAEGGTLFLDEIGEIDAALQSKLLRVLETGKFRRLGGTRDLNANVRVVAATNRNLETMSESGGFRSDLYYRLSAFVIDTPPLRERREDIPFLAEHFIQNHKLSRRTDKSLSSDAARRLTAYDWPGNVRELKNVVATKVMAAAI